LISELVQKRSNRIHRTVDDEEDGLRSWWVGFFLAFVKSSQTKQGRMSFASADRYR
jgi:hypothetical protein